MQKIGIHDPWISETDHEEVSAALSSNWISGGGAKVAAFERAFADFLGLPEPAVSTVNGTSALQLALLSCDFRPQEHMLVSAYGFVATANVVRHLGGEPIFVGPAGAERPVVQLAQLEEFFGREVDEQNRYRRTGRPLRGMLYNEPYGLADPSLPAIADFLERRGLVLIEDASQSLGSRIDNRPLGTIGHLAAFSFNGNKTLTTGAGGALVSRDLAWLRKARRLQSQSRSDDFDFYYGEEAYNFLLSNVLAGFGLAQLRKLPDILANKQRIRAAYREALKGSGWKLLGEELDFPAWLNVAVAANSRDRAAFRELAARLERAGVRARPAFPAVTENAMYRSADVFFTSHLQHLFERGICLPSGPLVSVEEVQTVTALLAREGRTLGFV